MLESYAAYNRLQPKPKIALPCCMECRRGLTMIILSVRPSVKRVHYDQTWRKIYLDFIPYERSFSLVFWEEEWLVGATPSTLNVGSTGPRWSEIADFEPVIPRSASAVIPAEKSSINSNRKFSNKPKMIILRCPWDSKKQNGRFSSKIEFRLKKVCYKVYSCDNCGRQSCRAFIGLTIHAKMVDGERPLLREILGQTDRVGAKSPIFDLCSLVAPLP